MGSVSVFERDGVYQLYVTDMVPDGAGNLQLEFEKLKKELEAEGLFDKAHKKLQEVEAKIAASAGAVASKPEGNGGTGLATDVDNEADDDTRVRFVGTYQTKMFDANDYSVLMLGAQNKLYYPSRGAGIGAQRAYFKLGGDETQMSRLTSFIMDFSDGETTGIISISSPIHPEGGCYTLDGRKLSQKPAMRGVYIVNGKKIIIK